MNAADNVWDAFQSPGDKIAAHFQAVLFMQAGSCECDDVSHWFE